MSRQGIMLCYPYDPKRVLKWPVPWIAQPKIDGLRCRAQIGQDGQVKLLSSQGNEITSVPHLDWELGQNKSLRGLELDGELYCHQWSFQQLCSVVKRTRDIHPNHQEVEFWVFDLKQPGMEQKDRLDKLALALGEPTGPIKRVECLMQDRVEEISQACLEYVARGFEGVVLRHPQALYKPAKVTTMLKLKPRKRDCYKIIGWSEEISIHDEPKGALGAFVCAKDDQVFSVGTGPAQTRSARLELWDRRQELLGKWLLVKYQELTDRGVPRFPVAFEIVDKYVGD